MIIFKYKWQFLIVALTVLLSACDDEWETHYNPETSHVIDMRLAEYISTNSEWSIFYTMLHSTGYDTILNQSQTYTVWVPDNNALKDVDLNDEEKVLNIVKGHIARFANSTSGLDSTRINMLNEKYIDFGIQESEANIRFGNATLLSKDILVNNGFIHSINEYVPYYKNIWEYIETTAGLDSLKKYIHKRDYEILDEDGLEVLSIENFLIDSIGKINEEDSLFTIILPKNETFINNYNKVKSLFVFLEADGGKKRQEQISIERFLKDMAFRGRVDNPASKDSLVSTYGSVLKDMDKRFEFVDYQIASNGDMYIADSLYYDLSQAGFDTITIEAEDFGDQEAGNSIAVSKSSLGTDFDLSGDGYLECEFTGGRNSSSVYIPIKGVLSGTYNIYCVFAPYNIETDDYYKTQVAFEIIYQDEEGKEIIEGVRSNDLDVSVTDSAEVTKLFVKEFTFPIADIPTSSGVVPKVELRVKNDIKPSKLPEGYTSNLRIDAVILEPVK